MANHDSSNSGIHSSAGDAAGRCSVCILPATTKGLKFDDSGICGLCKAQPTVSKAPAQESAGHRSIEDELQKIRDLGKGRKYDCLVGLSGGRDSSYLLYLLTRKHNLRCLAAHYCTPFTDDVIQENVQRTVSLLDVPLVQIDISQQFHSDFARKIILMFKKKPLPELVHLLCAPCKYVNKEVFRIARQHDIKAIVFGGSKAETFQFGATTIPKKLGKHELYFTAQAKKGLSAMKRGALLLARNPLLFRYLPTGFKSILSLNPHSAYLRMRYPDVLRVDYFFHEEYVEAECERVITQELGWRLPPGCNSYWRADCSMAEVKNLLFSRLVGATYMDAYLSNKIRFGEISREEALDRLKKEGRVSEHRLRHVAEVLGLPLDAFEPSNNLGIDPNSTHLSPTVS